MLLHLRRRPTAVDAAKVAFHLHNASIALERVETGRPTEDVTVASLRRSLNTAIRRADDLVGQTSGTR